MNKKRKGFITGIVLLIFLIIVLAVALIYKFSSTNFQTTKFQLRNTEATYLAKAGVDLGLSAAFTKGIDGKTLIEEYKNSGKDSIKQEVSLQDIKKLMGTDTSNKEASLWIYMGLATDDENKEVSGDERTAKKYLKIAAKAYIGKVVNMGDDVQETSDIKFDERYLFVNLNRPEEQLYVNPSDGYTWDNIKKVEW